MKPRAFKASKISIVSLSIYAVALCCACSALAVLAPARDRLTNYDRRGQAEAVAASAIQKEAVSQLQATTPKLEVQFDQITGSAAHVSARDGFLTGAQPQLVGSDASAPTLAFLDANRALFGHGAEALDQAKIKREFVTAHNDLRTIIWEQQVDGIPVFEAVLFSHTTGKGELVNISSRFVVNPEQAATQGTPTRVQAVSNPVITAEQAVAAAARDLGEEADAQQINASAAAVGPEKKQKHNAPFLAGESETQLTWVPMDGSNLRLCWDVILTSRTRGEMFRVLLDAQTGETLIRRNLTDYLSNISLRVFTSDSPSPMSPGLPTPANTQPPLLTRTLVTLAALDTNASPAGWIDDGGNETRGNNVDAHTDRNNDNSPDLPRPQGSPFRVFDFPMDLTQSPATYTNAAVVQLFYLCNWMHDRLYQLGFTEAAGNFQSNNFGRGGLGNDAVQADAQDGGGFNNANFSTPPDGSAGRMQMYIFNGPLPNRDGDFDAEVVLHEYTHGLSNRRVGGGVGISALQSGGMGEGWSDWYGLTLLSEAGDDVNGNYAAGAYVTYQLSGMTQNYYFGIRRYPYTTDLTKNPLTFKDIDPAQASTHPGIPRSSIIGTTANEVHNMGEVWCVTLWEARANLINRYGWAVGNQLILQLVTDGMNLSPANPNFLQARDAIIQADLVDTGGANRAQLWAAFAKRGMGVSATSPVSSTTTGLHEAYDLPDDLVITPAVVSSAGFPGGPFTPSPVSFVLTNSGTNPISWTLMNTSGWVTIGPASGILVGSTVTNVFVSANSGANVFPPGIYTAGIWFSNLTSGLAQFRQFRLAVVGQNMFDNFEPGIHLSQWSDFGGVVGSTVLATNYGGSVSGVNSLWFGDDGSRYATTLPIDSHNGGVISFWLHLGSGSAFPWEQVDLPGKGIVLEYSTNNGASWTAAGTYNTATYYNWTFVTLSIPAGAQSPATLYRWRQLIHSGSAFDHWALDDVFVNAGPLAPSIVNQPQSQTNVVGDPVSLSVLVVGTQPIFYQWLFNGTNLAGATNSFINFNRIQFSNAGTYSVVLSNSVGTSNSANAVLTVTPPPPCSPVVAGLVSWWKAEGSALDQTGGNNGTLLGSATFGPGRVGQAFAFDGVSGGVTLNNPPALQLQNLTIETWIRRASTALVSSGTGGNGTLLGCGPGGYYFWLRNDGVIGFNLLGDPAYLANFSISDTNYHHVAVTRNGSVINFYLDGTPYAGPAYNPTFVFTNSVSIGIRPDNLDNSFNGNIDELAIYNRALSAAEVQAIYAAGGTGKCSGPVPPSIIVQPTNQTVVVGSAPSMDVLAAGSPPLGYQWLRSGTNLPGRTDPSLLFANAQLADSGAYSCLVTNPYGSITSSVATLTVLPGTLPAIVLQPSNVVVSAGGSATFSVTATGTAPLRYLWRRNGSAIAGATNSFYTTNTVQVADSGTPFSCLVSNAFGSVPSSNAVLTVLVATNSCAGVPSGIVSWWPGENNANDFIDGNNGLLHSITFAPGEVGQAFNFNGTTAYVSFNASSNLNVGLSNGYTLESWIYPTDTSSTHILWEYNNGSGTVGAHMYHSDPGIGGLGALAANVVSTTGIDHIFASSSGIITRTNFQHVALTYDKTSGVAKLYRNGAVVASNTIGSFTPQTSFPLYLGVRVSGPAAVGSYYAGLMDEPSIYSRALSDAEIASIYNAGTSGKCGANHPPVAANMNAATKRNLAMLIPIEKFLLASFDPDGDPLTVTVSAASTNGGSVALASNLVTYVPVASFIGSDRYTYFVNDGRGGTNSAFVLIQVRSPDQQSGNMLPLVTVSNGIQVGFVGVPGYTYTLQRATNISGPWISLGPVPADVNGLGTFTDTDPPPGSAFYRTTYP